MRILVHTIFYRPELTGVAKYTAELCEFLAARGHDVHVVAPPPYYPQWRVQEPYRKRRYAAEQLGGVRVRRAPIWLPKNPGGLGRMLCALSFAVSSLPLMLHESFRAPDLVLVIEPSLLNSVVALATARSAGSMVWLHVQDFEVDLAYDLGQLRRGRKLAERVEGWILRRFDVVSSITGRLLRKALRKGVSPERAHLFPNWFDPSEICPLPYTSPLRAELGVEEETIVAMFSGSLGAKQGVEIIIEAARALADEPRVLFLICGEGVAERALRSQAGRLNNVRFLPLQPADRLNELLNAADIHLLPQRASASGSVMPSKLIGMLASGRPVVASAGADSEIAELIDGCGVAVAPGEAALLAMAVRALADNHGERARLGKAARQRALELFRQDLILADFEHHAASLAPRVSRQSAERFASE